MVIVCPSCNLEDFGRLRTCFGLKLAFYQIGHAKFKISYSCGLRAPKSVQCDASINITYNLTKKKKKKKKKNDEFDVVEGNFWFINDVIPLVVPQGSGKPPQYNLSPSHCASDSRSRNVRLKTCLVTPWWHLQYTRSCYRSVSQFHLKVTAILNAVLIFFSRVNFTILTLSANEQSITFKATELTTASMNNV